MKKLFVLLSLVSFIGLHQSRACSCDILPTFRVSLYYNYDFVNHMPDSAVYVFLALNAENFENNSAGNLDSAHIVVLQQYYGIFNLADTITYNTYRSSCAGGVPDPGDTVIAWMRSRIDDPVTNPLARYFTTSFCYKHYLQVKNGMVLGWGDTPFPLSDFRDTLDAFNQTPHPGPLSVHDIRQQVAFNLFPNPAGNVLQIDISGTEIAELQLLNLAGSVVLRQQTKRNTFSADIALLTPGIYLAVATDRSGQVYRRKFVKR